MAEYYLLPKSLVRRAPRLEKVALRLEGRLLQGLFALIRALPPRWRSASLGWLAGAIGPLTDKAGKARDNLAIIQPQLDAKQQSAAVRDIFRHFGRAIAELFNAPSVWENRRQLLEFVTAPEAEVIVSSGRPTVYVTAHVGAWQYTNFLGAHYGFPVTSVYAREPNPIIHDMFYQLRCGLRAKWIPSEGSVRALLKELRSGNSIGLAVDTRLDDGDMVPFFGIAAPTNTVAARLALRHHCDLVPVRCERLPAGRYRITTCAPITATDPQASVDQQALDMTEQLNRVFEGWIRENPGEWLCLKRRWPKSTSSR